MTRAELLAFLRSQRYAVQASVSAEAGVQAAVVGIAVADDFAIVFDTVDTSRKAKNLAADSRIALVIGGVRDGEEQTVQCEGLAERLRSSDMRVVEELYFRKFPDGRDRLGVKGIMHLRVRPLWLRYSDSRTDPPTIIEMDAAGLAALR
ncbi:MAG: pyridoxamine 5'-phosphate oxidase family protein [Gemmatimonadetes bacterium]|nr:pyridoxamine 5'-phosphate oxidase family protein [Gemmatimonadota bacterium]